MKKTKKISLKIVLSLMVLFLISLVSFYTPSYAEENYPNTFKASFVNSYKPQEYPKMQYPPIKTSIDGQGREVFCCEPGKELRPGKMYKYKRTDIRELSDKIACAIGSINTIQDKVAEDYRYKQAIIWGDNKKGGLSYGGTAKVNLNNGINKKERGLLRRVGGGDLETGKTVWKQAQSLVKKAKNYKKDATFEFVHTNPTLKVNDNGTYTIGPFRINYTKDDWSKITSIYLQDNNGNKYNVDMAPSNVPVNKNFYVTVNKNDLQNAAKVKLVAEYSHEYYTGTYAKYKATGSNSHQQLIMCDVQHETQKQTKDFGEIILTIDLKGRVFLDQEEGKGLEPDGMDQDKKEPGMKDIPVWLMNADNNQVIAETKTGENGYYEFKDVSAAGNYYICFQYNGQLYEPTTYNYKKAKPEEKSYATEGMANRQAFNNKFAEISNQTDVSDQNKQIKAYSGWDGLNGLKIYNVNTEDIERNNINLGLMEREKANLVLNKDLWEVNVSINQKNEKYIYNGRNDEDMKIALRGTDISPYERKLYREDIEYTGENPLSVQVTYRIRMYNASSGNINTEVTNLIDYYDTMYTPIVSYTDPNNKAGTAVTWNNQGSVSENGYTYNKMATAGYATGSFTSGESRYVYVDYQVKPEEIKNLLNTNERTAENYAEIGSYKTYYADTRLDLNKKLDPNDTQARVMHEAGKPAGLIDINSVPGNFKPTDPAVYEFVHVTSKSESYQNQNGEEKAKARQKFFEDDADSAPGLKLVVANEPRTLSGNVWDDITTVDKNGIRKGDGVFKDESGINKVKVQLIEEKNYNADSTENTLASQEKRTESRIVAETEVAKDGSYEFSSFIPGDYYLRFTYGDKEALAEYDARYNGQDYKSTVYRANEHTDKYWYAQNVETRNSDATDNLGRREAVNNYSKDLTNYKANVLNKQNVEELANATWMYADTAKMPMEIEYARTETNHKEESSYHVINVDFGLAERPRSELTADKKVSHVKLFASDGQVIFDTSSKVSNLAWIEGEYIQGTVDNNLIHGATLELTYEMKVTNTGEKDYQDATFYQTYEIPGEDKIVKTKPNMVLDYVANNLSFDKALAENVGWDVINKEELQKGTQESLVNDSIDLAKQQTIVQANNKNDLVTKALKPGESSTSTMKLTQALTSGGQEDDLTYYNYIEIVSSHNDNGRRSYQEVVSIPGDFNPTDPKFEQPDTATSEQVVILPPFGNDNQTIYFIIGGTLLGVIILGVGIYFIKKKIIQ